MKSIRKAIAKIQVEIEKREKELQYLDDIDRLMDDCVSYSYWDKDMLKLAEELYDLLYDYLDYSIKDEVRLKRLKEKIETKRNSILEGL